MLLLKISVLHDIFKNRDLIRYNLIRTLALQFSLSVKFPSTWKLKLVKRINGS